MPETLQWNKIRCSKKKKGLSLLTEILPVITRFPLAIKKPGVLSLNFG